MTNTDVNGQQEYNISDTENSTFRHAPNWKLPSLSWQDPFPVFQPVAFPRHAKQLTFMHQPVQHGGSDNRIAYELAPILKIVIRSNDD